MEEAVTPLAPVLADHAVSIDWLAEAQRIAQLYERPAIGRPSTICDVYRVNELLKRLAAGNFKSTAALAAGFSRQHLANWTQDAKEGQPAAIALLDAIEKAEAVGESSDLEALSRHQSKEWTASAWKLERKYPEKWGRRQDSESGPKVVVQIGAAQGDVKVTVATLSGQEQTASGLSQAIDITSEQLRLTETTT